MKEMKEMETTGKHVIMLQPNEILVIGPHGPKDYFNGYLTEPNGEPIGSWIFPGDCTYRDIRGILADDGFYDVEIIDQRDDELDIMATV